MNKVCTMNRLQDIEFWLSQPFLAKKKPILAISVGFRHIYYMEHLLESACSGSNEV